MDGSSFFASFKAASTSSKEIIQFNSGAIDSFPIKGNEVTIVPSAGDHDMGSSKVQISNIVNFGWDYQYSHGQLVAVHNSGTYFAYGIVSPGKNTGMVRVVQKKTDQRALIKGMKGKIKDLAFSHCVDQIILGVVDEHGTLFVYRIEKTSDDDSDNDKSLQTELLLQINSSSTKENEVHRLLWCPFLPYEDEEADSSSARLLVLTHGPVAEMWNIDMVIRDHGASAILDGKQVENGKLVVCDHGDAIMDASFSPDGTALATASADGNVKFFQVYMHGNGTPRCLHQWKPHDGQSVSSLFFLDNHKEHNPDEQFWKFALTGCNQNTELKLWSCENWTCLQTIQFQPQDGKRVALKAVIDLSAQYLLLADLYRKNVYILQLEAKDDAVKFVSVSEFATPSPFLSMAMLEAGIKKVGDKHTLGEDDDSDDDEEDPQATSREATVISFLLVQPKSLQECRIVYDDAFSQPQVGTSPNAPIEAIKKEPPTTPSVKEELKEAADKITLMSPEVFSATPPKIKEEPASPVILLEEPPKRGASMLPIGAAGGGSSPSREVQDILGDSEEQGGLGAEIIITEEDDDIIESDDICDDEEDEDSDELSKMLDKANAKIKQEMQIKSELDPLAVKLQEGLRIKQEPIRIKEEKLSQSPILASGGHAHSASDNDLAMVMSRLADMTALIQTQRAEMQVWREEMRELRREDSSNFKSILDDSSSEVKKNSQAVMNSVKANLKASIGEEIRKATPLLIQAANNSLADALNKEVRGKVLKSDLALKDAISKLATSRAVSETLANAVATSLTPAIRASFKDALTASLIPAFERSMQNLFVQMSSTLNKGLKEYEGQLRAHVCKQLDPVVKELKDSKKTANDLEKKLTNLIRHEMRTIATPSRATSEAPSTPNANSGPSVAEIQGEIMDRLTKGKINDAFAMALSANNLSIVVFTCEKVNPNQILNQVPCPLTQEVLLSLIQQMGRNLESNSDLKLRYLEEAITNLDQNNLTIRPHLPSVMSMLYKQLTAYAERNPNKKLKMLLMATQALKSIEA